jgi:hypothetical protein
LADYSVTTSSVALTSGHPITGIAGEAIDAGECVYYDATNAVWKLASSSDATTANCQGIALVSATTNQQFAFARDDSLIQLGSITIGRVYALSANAGKVKLEAELSAGEFGTIVAFTTSDGFVLHFKASGVAYG